MEDKKRHGALRVIGSIILGVVIAAAFSVAIGALVMVLWNWLMPELFGLGVITYWQGFGLALLAKLLFGRIGQGHKAPDEEQLPRRRRLHRNTRGCDDAYESWWKEEGSQRFEDYMKRGGTEKEPEPGE